MSEETRFIDWTCTRPLCGLVQTTMFFGPIEPSVRIFGCARCRTLYRLAMHPTEPAVVALVGPRNEYVSVGPLALQRMHMPAATEVPKATPADGDAP